MLSAALFLALLSQSDVSSKKDCFVVHGRLQITNGTPSFRIWKVGTKRVLGVLPDESPESLPESIRKWLKDGIYIYADFSVRPLTEERPGWMQMVNIVKAHNIVVAETIDGEIHIIKRIDDAP